MTKEIVIIIVTITLLINQKQKKTGFINSITIH